MAEITAASVGKLRAMTGAGLMDCKKALTEANGEIETAVDILRKKGAASAAKKSSRAAKEGVIAQAVSSDSKSGILVEINCETDFVAKNDSFREFCDEIAQKLLANPEADLEADRTAQVAKIGENIVIARSEKFAAEGAGAVSTYIHTGSKVGVMVELSAGKDESAANESFKSLGRDLALQIAATSPQSLNRDGIDKSIIEKEVEIVREQMKDKPAAAIENILKGKLEKYYQGVCLVDQAFVKDGNLSIKEHVAAVGKELGDEIAIKRFSRFQLGETSEG